GRDLSRRAEADDRSAALGRCHQRRSRLRQDHRHAFSTRRLEEIALTRAAPGLPVTAQVELKNVAKTFPATRATSSLHALGPLDLELHPGEFFAVVGPS